MKQGMHVGEATSKRGQKTVPVTTKTISDDKLSRPFIDHELFNETIRSKQPFFSSFALTPQASNGQEFLIRILDIVGSFTILIFGMPAIFLVALLIKITSHGPILYGQKRVGKGGKIFTLYKFRTMLNNSEEHTGPIWADKNDPRVTPVGRVLRKTRFDEIPQIFNVLQGDMSLVGPRPERPYFVKRHKALQGIRLMVKPGLTGLAQVSNSYGLKPDHKIKYDYLYIQKRSLMLNLYILLKTVPTILSKSGW